MYKMDKDIIELNKKRGKRLSYERTRNGITQEAFAELANCSIQQISYIENGKRKMSYEYATIFSKILGVSKEYLMCEDDFKTSGEYTEFDIPRLVDMYSNILSILFEYNYDFIGMSYPTLKKSRKVPCEWNTKQKINCLSRIIINKEAAGEFFIEFIDTFEEVKFFLFIIKTPMGNIIEIMPDELLNCISNIIQYSQLQFLNLGQNKGFDKLKPIRKANQNNYFHYPNDK